MNQPHAPNDDRASAHAEHTEHTVRSLAQMSAEHYQNASRPERLVASLTGVIARPLSLAAIAVAVCFWIGANLALAALGRGPVDPPPFLWLSDAVGVLSLLMVVLIIGAQRHEEQLAQRREMLILEIVLLSEKKIAKAIALMEEARRDNPLIPDRSDPGADNLAQPADPRSVLDAIRHAQAHTQVQPRQVKPQDKADDQAPDQAQEPGQSDK